MPQTKERKEKFKSITVELPNELFSKLEEACKLGRTTRSNVVRHAIWKYVGN